MDIKEYKVSTSQSKQNHPWEFARFKAVSDIINRKILKNKKNSNEKSITILDIGCGDGFFLEQLAKENPYAQCFAIDTAFDDEMIDFFQKKYEKSNIEFYKSITDERLKEVKADIVLLLDVIEHIENDVQFLNSLSLSDKINTNTQIVITVHAYQKLFCAHDTWLGHFRRYTINMLEEHVQKSGLTSSYSGYFFFSLLLPRWIQMINEKKRNRNEKTPTGVGDWRGGKLKFNLIVSILYLDYLFSKFLRFLGIKLPGLSCFTICRKSQ